MAITRNVIRGVARNIMSPDASTPPGPVPGPGFTDKFDRPDEPLSDSPNWNPDTTFSRVCRVISNQCGVAGLLGQQLIISPDTGDIFDMRMSMDFVGDSESAACMYAINRRNYLGIRRIEGKIEIFLRLLGLDTVLSTYPDVTLTTTTAVICNFLFIRVYYDGVEQSPQVGTSVVGPEIAKLGQAVTSQGLHARENIDAWINEYNTGSAVVV